MCCVLSYLWVLYAVLCLLYVCCVVCHTFGCCVLCCVLRMGAVCVLSYVLVLCAVLCLTWALFERVCVGKFE